MDDDERMRGSEKITMESRDKLWDAEIKRIYVSLASEIVKEGEFHAYNVIDYSLESLSSVIKKYNHFDELANCLIHIE